MCTCTYRLRSMHQCWSQHKCHRSDTDSIHKRRLQIQAGEEADQENKTGTTVDTESPALLHMEAVAAGQTQPTASAVAAMWSKDRLPLRQPQRRPWHTRRTLDHPHRRRPQQAPGRAQQLEPPHQPRRCSRSDKQGSAARIQHQEACVRSQHMSYQAATSTDRYPSACSRPRLSHSSHPSVSAAL